jgi:putative transposase
MKANPPRYTKMASGRYFQTTPPELEPKQMLTYLANHAEEWKEIDSYMMVTYKFRLYPTALQEQTMAETMETCRRLYNDLLDDRIRHHTGTFEQKRSLTVHRKESKYLKQVHSQVLQDVTFRLGKAFGAFFAGLTRYPRFKRTGRYNSFRYPQYGGFKVAGGRLYLSMIGKVRIVFHREIEGRMKTCTIIRDIDQWYACIASEKEDSKSPINDKPSVGIDLGVTSIAALSNGTIIPAPKLLEKSEIAIKTLQRSLSRKQKGSKNREKARIALEKSWRKLRNRRNDFAHKTSRFFADKYSVIVFEDLKIPNMVRNHRLASAILDACWGKTRQLTVYKAERRGGRVILVEPRGTSQECSGCGKVVEKPLSVRTHSCPYCGLELDRDVNAARNILARGLEQARAETEPLPVIRIGKFGRGSKKPVAFGRG